MVRTTEVPAGATRGIAEAAPRCRAIAAGTVVSEAAGVLTVIAAASATDLAVGRAGRTGRAEDLETAGEEGPAQDRGMVRGVGSEAVARASDLEMVRARMNAMADSQVRDRVDHAITGGRATTALSAVSEMGRVAGRIEAVRRAQSAMVSRVDKGAVHRAESETGSATAAGATDRVAARAMAPHLAGVVLGLAVAARAAPSAEARLIAVAGAMDYRVAGDRIDRAATLAIRLAEADRVVRVARRARFEEVRKAAGLRLEALGVADLAAAVACREFPEAADDLPEAERFAGADRAHRVLECNPIPADDPCGHRAAVRRGAREAAE